MKCGDLCICIQPFYVWNSTSGEYSHSDVLDKLEPGERVIILDTGDGWNIKILTPRGIDGWVDTHNFPERKFRFA
jgi:hypothetical protein